MRTTLRIDDQLFEQVRSEAHRQRISIATLVNRLLRRGLQSPAPRRPAARRYREAPLSMGQPLVNIDKAVSFAADLEDAQTLEELRRRK
jgi:hypothetical protein